MKKIIFAFFAIISLFSISLFAQSFAITNAKIVTVSGAEIAKGNVIIRDGLISEVGENAKIPADAKVFDATGLTVYPGLFDVNTSLALPAQSRPQGPPQAGGQPQPVSNSNYPAVLQPEITAFEKLTPGEAQFEPVRNNGFTTVLTVSREGIFNGQSAVINLAGDSVSSMVLKAPFAQHITYRTNGGNYPGSLMGTFSALRQMFLDAQRLKEWKKAYSANPLGMKRPDADASLEALIPLLNREMPVVFNANSEIEIIRSLDFAKEFNLKPIINGGNEAWKVADRLKKADAIVFLSLNFPKKNTSNSPEADPEPIETLRFRVDVPKNAAKLTQAGVKFAFQSGGMQNLGEFLANANKAVENGLSKENALKAMTLSSAEILGVSNRLGSIEKGKIANLVVTKGDIFAKDKVFTHIFVDGKLFEQKPPPKVDATRPTGATVTPTATSVLQVAGTWNLSIDAGGQTLPVILTLTQQGNKISGTMQAGPLGTSEIKNGEVTAKGMSFDATVNFGGQSIDLSFNGTITGNQLSGNISSPMG
ncbi:MAG: amidohydrolase family protein, partial [Pyrinomonadaceae bacterium]|nr:amidohydrolase family protein [Pyrinomonadaceae bacterium]